LNDAYLARLDIEGPELSLDVQSTLLWDNEKIAIRVHEGAFLHALGCGEDVGSQSFPQSRIPRAGNRAESRYEIGAIRDVEGKLQFNQIVHHV
jgi:hypothetical protein